MKLCKDCKHWYAHGQPKLQTEIEFAGECRSEKFINANDPRIGHRTPENGLRYWDYEGYACGFETGPEFGCVHWEAK